VRFRSLSGEEIAAYVATGEPMDKAGSYGIQGRGCVLVERVEGCYFNVMGLPVSLLLSRLRSAAGAQGTCIS
jgi:septum formation protein